MSRSGIAASIGGWREQLVSPRVRARLLELQREQAEVRLLRLLLGETKTYEWALSIGTLRDPGLRALVPPIPDEALRRITANESPEEFLWTGLVDVHTVLELYERHGTATRSRPRVLDFGCGCGRLLRFLVEHHALFELHGTDVNPDLVAWCREHLERISFGTNGPRPPLRHDAASFDLAWSLSVFTHLDEPLGDLWRAELARILAPGGTLVLTVHGRTALARIRAEEELARRFALGPERLDEIEREIETAGVAFVPYDAPELAAAKAGDVYGNLFTCAEHVERRWTSAGFELRAYLPGALRGWQDVVVLARR